MYVTLCSVQKFSVVLTTWFEPTHRDVWFRSLKNLKLTFSWSLERSPWFKCDRVDCTNPDCAVDILLAVLLADGDGDDDLGDGDHGQDGDMDMRNNDDQNQR